MLSHTAALFGITTLSGLSGLGRATAQRAPAMFIGHGSPMNLVQDNSITQSWQAMGKRLQANPPQAILVVSAHWQSPQSTVNTVANPDTIHDFYNFPEALYQVRYPAPGVSDSHALVQQAVQSTDILADDSRGIDHGVWVVLHFMFPEANIPVFQLSLSRNLPPERHYQIGQELSALRDRGVMIVGSGNLVHNLRMLQLYRASGGGEQIEDWAMDFDQQMVKAIDQRRHQHLVNAELELSQYRDAHPTDEHYLPLLYAAGASRADDQIEYFADEFFTSAISMRSVLYS